MRKSILFKYISGQLNPSEKEAVVKWIRANSENQKIYNTYKAAWVAKQLKDIPSKDSVKSIKGFSYHEKKSNFKKYSLSIAASLLLISVLSFSYFYSDIDSLLNKNELIGKNIVNVITAKGKKELVNLPDGSTVTLNVDSKISYPNNFEGNIREVQLVGEAFFDVKRNESKPFIVYANEIKIKVLGTSFNIKSYPKDKNVETTLVTGKVEVLKKKEKTPVVLNPSQRAVYNKSSNKLKVDTVKSEDITAWKKGKLIFNKTPISQVIHDLERNYDVKFIIKSKELLSYEYTGTFNDLTIKEVLEFLKISSPIAYEIKENSIILSMNK